MEKETPIVGESEGAAAAPAINGLLWPFLITVTALLVWIGFQTVQLARERINLGAVKSSQDGAIREAEKIRVQFESLLANTSALANQGHAGARMVIDELQRRGVGVQMESQPAVKDFKGK